MLSEANIQVRLNGRMNYGPMDTLARRAKAARDFRRLTQVQASRLSGIKQSDISKIERGETLRPQGLLAMASAYDCDPRWLDSGEGAAPWDSSNVEDGPTVKGAYPIISMVQAGNWSQVCDNFQPGDAEEWVMSPHNLGRHGYVLRVKGQSMTAPEGSRYSFPEGVLLHVKPEADAQPGQFVIARRNTEDEATFKRLVLIDGERYLEALNPDWPNRFLRMQEGDAICGVVVDASFGNLP